MAASSSLTNIIDVLGELYDTLYLYYWWCGFFPW